MSERATERDGLTDVPADELLSWIAEDCGHMEAEREILRRLWNAHPGERPCRACGHIGAEHDIHNRCTVCNCDGYVSDRAANTDDPEERYGPFECVECHARFSVTPSQDCGFCINCGGGVKHLRADAAPVRGEERVVRHDPYDDDLLLGLNDYQVQSLVDLLRTIRGTPLDDGDWCGEILHTLEAEGYEGEGNNRVEVGYRPAEPAREGEGERVVHCGFCGTVYPLGFEHGCGGDEGIYVRRPGDHCTCSWTPVGRDGEQYRYEDELCPVHAAATAHQEGSDGG